MAQNVTIDGKEYPLGALNDEAKSILASLQLVDKKNTELQQQLTINQTARNAYANALKAQLPSDDVIL